MHMRFAAALALLTGAIASEASIQGRDRIVPANLQWKEIVPGAHFAAVYGDWEKEAHGKYVRFVKGVQIPMHRHTNDYHAVAMSGRIVNLFEGGRRVEITPGDYFYMEAGRAHSHECVSEAGCLFYTYGSARWDFVPYEGPAQGTSPPERGK